MLPLKLFRLKAQPGDCLVYIGEAPLRIQTIDDVRHRLHQAAKALFRSGQLLEIVRQAMVGVFQLVADFGQLAVLQHSVFIGGQQQVYHLPPVG